MPIGDLLLKRYLLDAELGRGGMGVVYRSHDSLLDRNVAVKVLSAAGLGSEGRARLLHEAQAAAHCHRQTDIKLGIGCHAHACRGHVDSEAGDLMLTTSVGMARQNHTTMDRPPLDDDCLDAKLALAMHEVAVPAGARIGRLDRLAQTV